MTAEAGAELPLQMPRKDPHHMTPDPRRLVVGGRGEPLDGLAQRQELGLPRAAFGALHARKLVHGGVADLALHDLPVVQHGEAKGEPFEIMANDPVAHEWHQFVPVDPRAENAENPAACQQQRQSIAYWNATSAKLRSFRECSRSDSCCLSRSSAFKPISRCWPTRRR